MVSSGMENLVDIDELKGNRFFFEKPPSHVSIPPLSEWHEGQKNGLGMGIDAESVR